MIQRLTPENSNCSNYTKNNCNQRVEKILNGTLKICSSSLQNGFRQPHLRQMQDFKRKVQNSFRKKYTSAYNHKLSSRAEKAITFHFNMEHHHRARGLKFKTASPQKYTNANNKLSRRAEKQLYFISTWNTTIAQ